MSLNAVFLCKIWFTTIEILNTELCDTHLWHFHIADGYYYNKPEWTILKFAFLVFVLVMAVSKFVKNTILAPNVGPLPQTQQLKLFNTLMPQTFRKSAKSAKFAKSAKWAKFSRIHKTTRGSSLAKQKCAKMTQMVTKQQPLCPARCPDGEDLHIWTFSSQSIISPLTWSRWMSWPSSTLCLIWLSVK